MSLFLPVGILVAASLIALSSISAHLFWLQLLWMAAGAGLIVFFSFVDWRSLLNNKFLIRGIYLLSLLLLVTVHFIGPIIRHARSWLVLGPFSFQPVELAKVALILFYAEYFSRRHLGVARWANIFNSFILFILPAILVAMQPNLGSALVLFGIWFGFLLFSGLPPRRVLVSLAVFAAAGFLIWTNVLKTYQRDRIIGFLYPERNSLGVNYSVIQSKIAIGSAGFWGKGYGQGTQTQLGFLAEPESDFILSAFIEEWGVFGGLLIIGAFLGMIFQILRIGGIADRNFEKFICLGVAIVFGMQFLLNTGSGLGLTPVVGIPFPFLSYGGSSLMTSFLLLAVVGSISRKS